MSRAETEGQLEGAALDLLRRDGVLAGLNLREVANHAGVNRGLVYHYFGSRQALLRSALGKNVGRRLAELRSGDRLPFQARFRRLQRVMTGESEAIRLMTLLVLDGDDQLTTMPLRTQTRRQLEADKDAGTLAPDLDLEAVQAAIVSFTWGYVVYREALAREFEMPSAELDERVAVVFDLMLRGFAPTQRTEPGSSEGEQR
jgi:AcrR family transcriptional regulator